MKSIGFAFVTLALVFFHGCTPDKKIYDMIAKLEKRIEALEKIVLPQAEQPAAQESAYEIPLEGSPMLGDKDAKVNVVVFSNFQCPFCARADKALRDLVNGRLKGQVNVVFKHFPFERHPEAKPAAKAALAAGEQGKFWEMAEIIFKNQNNMNEKNYRVWAKKIGLNLAKFETDLKEKDKAYDELIDKDIKIGAENAKLEGTPWILVNGWLLEGDISPETIEKMMKDKNL